jgi:Rhodopirellula transposase DDE domain
VTSGYLLVKRLYSSQHPDRNQQFEYIEEQIARFRAASEPIISVDTKKKELIGEFKQAGKTWVQEPIEVNCMISGPKPLDVRLLMASTTCNRTRARSMWDCPLILPSSLSRQSRGGGKNTGGSHTRPPARF